MNYSLEVLTISGNIIFRVDNINNITPKILIKRIRNETEYKWALKLVTLSNKIIGINQTMNNRIIDILSTEKYSDTIQLTLVMSDIIFEICDFDLIFNFSLNNFNKQISDIKLTNLEEHDFTEKKDDFEEHDFNYMFEREISIIIPENEISIIFPDEEDRTDEINILTDNLNYYNIEKETMNNILVPLLIELALSTTKSKVWVKVIINLINKSSIVTQDSPSNTFKWAIINNMQDRFEYYLSFLYNNPRKILALVTLLARLFVSKFFPKTILAKIAHNLYTHCTNQTYFIILSCLILLEKITRYKLRSTEDGVLLNNEIQVAINDLRTMYK